MSNSPLGAGTDWRNPERENITTEFNYEKCDLCTGEAKHYFQKHNECLCDDCWDAAIKESLIELSYKF